MSVCDLGYEHADVAEPVVAAPVTEAVVAVAEIEAERDITLARIAAKSGEDEREARIAALEGRLAGIAETLDRIAPPAVEPVEEPTPVIVQAPEEEPIIDEPAVVPPPVVEEPVRKQKAKSVWW